MLNVSLITRKRGYCFQTSAVEIVRPNRTFTRNPQASSVLLCYKNCSKKNTERVHYLVSQSAEEVTAELDRIATTFPDHVRIVLRPNGRRRYVFDGHLESLGTFYIGRASIRQSHWPKARL